MSEERKAFIFDTNFIIQYKDMIKVVEELSDNFTVYVTQVSIGERIAQQTRELKSTYEKLQKIEEEHKEIVNLQYKFSFENRSSFINNGMQENYRRAFNNMIIPLNLNQETFAKLIERSHKKTPPFSQFESDKGFKDTLLWLSLLNYFIEQGEDQIVFVTDDKGFLSNKDALIDEFVALTGKK